MWHIISNLHYQCDFIFCTSNGYIIIVLVQYKLYINILIIIFLQIEWDSIRMSSSIMSSGGGGLKTDRQTDRERGLDKCFVIYIM